MARRTTKHWTCPRCGRRFARSNQSHSCRVRQVEDHFRGKPRELRALFDALCRALEQTGPLRVDAAESSINLVSKHHFGGVAVRRGYLRVGFIADHAIHDQRIARVERIGAHRVSHHVILRSMGELNPQLLRWLAAAQSMQA